jgi:hypothetical protein
VAALNPYPPPRYQARRRQRGGADAHTKPSCRHQVSATSSIAARDLFVLRASVPPFRVLSLRVLSLDVFPSRGAPRAWGMHRLRRGVQPLREVAASDTATKPTQAGRSPTNALLNARRDGLGAIRRG